MGQQPADLTDEQLAAAIREASERCQQLVASHDPRFRGYFEAEYQPLIHERNRRAEMRAKEQANAR